MLHIHECKQGQVPNLLTYLLKYLHSCTTFCIKLSLICYYALILWVTYRQCPRGPKECEWRLLHKWLQPHTVASIICWRKSCWCLQWWWGRWTWRTRQTQLTFFWNNFNDSLHFFIFFIFSKMKIIRSIEQNLHWRDPWPQI